MISRRSIGGAWQRAADRRRRLGLSPRRLARNEVVAIILIALGIISIGAARARRPNPRAFATALATGAFIAAYLLNDGTGARLSGSLVAVYAWMTILNAAMTAAILARYRPGALPALPWRAPAGLSGSAARPRSRPMRSSSGASRTPRSRSSVRSARPPSSSPC